MVRFFSTKLANAAIWFQLQGITYHLPLSSSLISIIFPLGSPFFFPFLHLLLHELEGISDVKYQFRLWWVGTTDIAP